MARIIKNVGRKKRILSSPKHDISLVLHPNQEVSTNDFPSEFVDALMNQRGISVFEDNAVSLNTQPYTYLIRRDGALGDVLVLRALFQSHLDKKFIFFSHHKYANLFDLPNVAFVDLGKEMNYLSYPNSVFYNLNNIDNYLEYSSTMDMFEVFRKYIELPVVPIKWDISSTDETKEHVELITQGFVKRKKRIILQFCGSWAMRNIDPEKIDSLINKIIDKKFAVGVLGDDVEYPLKKRIGLYDFRGISKIEEISAFVELGHAIITLDSSLIYFANGSKNKHQQLLFSILGPNIGRSRVSYHPNGVHYSTAYDYGCYPCLESTERCGSKGIPECLKKCDVKKIVKGFLDAWAAFRDKNRTNVKNPYYELSDEHINNKTYLDCVRNLSKKYPNSK